MPLYEYRCPECGAHYELAFTSWKTEQVPDCLKCGVKVEKIISKLGKPLVIEGYSEMAGAHFTGPKQKARILKEKNLEEV